MISLIKYVTNTKTVLVKDKASEEITHGRALQFQLTNKRNDPKRPVRPTSTRTPLALLCLFSN
jgi:hypothetical protein